MLLPAEGSGVGRHMAVRGTRSARWLCSLGTACVHSQACELGAGLTVPQIQTDPSVGCLCASAVLGSLFLLTHPVGGRRGSEPASSPPREQGQGSVCAGPGSELAPPPRGAKN